MVSKPTVLPQWAENDVVDPVSGQNNVLEPPTEKQDEGWDRLEFPPRQWFNWLGRYTYRWLQWLNQQEEQSRVVDNSGTDPIADVVTGGMCIIYVTDTTTPANFYHGIAYVPPSPGGAITVTQIAASTLTVSTISVSGILTAAGGSGNYIIYGQMKTIP
jgi:hypothetical protein